MAETKLGFDGLVEADEEETTGYTVNFSSTERESPEAGVQEEITLIDTAESSSRSELTATEKKLKEQTVCFEDGVRKIDFILTYQDHERQEEILEGKKSPEHAESGEKTKASKKRAKRERYLDSCRELGLELEFQDCSESPDRKTFYVKIHATHDALLKGAEELLLRMPIRENNLHQSDWRERFFDWIKIRDPFEPVVPDHLEIDNYFTAPFDYERRQNYLGWDDEKNFFTTAQRSMIVWHHLQNARYGDEDDQIGILRLLQNSCFNNSFPLHDSSHKQKKDERDDSKMTERQFLYHRWSYWTNWYKRQPLDHIRRYFGEKIGIYFTWLGFYTTWLLPAAIIGIIVLIYGLTTVVNPVATDICSNTLRYDFYMCPRCDGRCDFWFLADSCAFSRLAQVFDNGGTVFFAIFMSFWAVMFLEFWKRRQFFLQYDWDMLGYEDAEQRARPQFEQKIKRAIRRRGNTPEARKKFTIHNPVLDRDEYIQPSYWLWPKIVTTIIILASMIVIVLGIVLSVLLYRLAVAGAIYAVVNGFPLGPTVGDIIVAVTGACIQLVFILLMNKIYGYVAYQLTNWELHRTQTEYEDQFTFKMYLFQFFNFYTSLFYIAFIKGNVSGNPGDYARIAGLRVDECATYGCLFELTIQLAIIMVGKQILNNVQELSLPYVKRIINWIKHKEVTEADIYARWEKDFDLIPLDKHGLFAEYLELVIQYGFTTIFVVAFPLAPFFAVLNNWFEIRLDAHKFTTVLRRPVAERAQDIGAWFYILTVISQLAVISNAFLIAITAQLVPIEFYAYGYRDQMIFRGVEDFRSSGYIDFSLSPFQVANLLDGLAFPGFEAHQLQLYNSEGVRIRDTAGNDLLYLPFIDFDCLQRQITFPPDMEFVTVEDPRYIVMGKSAVNMKLSHFKQVIKSCKDGLSLTIQRPSGSNNKDPTSSSSSANLRPSSSSAANKYQPNSRSSSNRCSLVQQQRSSGEISQHHFQAPGTPGSTISETSAGYHSLTHSMPSVASNVLSPDMKTGQTSLTEHEGEEYHREEQPGTTCEGQQVSSNHHLRGSRGELADPVTSISSSRLRTASAGSTGVVNHGINRSSFRSRPRDLYTKRNTTMYSQRHGLRPRTVSQSSFGTSQPGLTSPKPPDNGTRFSYKGASLPHGMQPPTTPTFTTGHSGVPHRPVFSMSADNLDSDTCFPPSTPRSHDGHISRVTTPNYSRGHFSISMGSMQTHV